MNTNNTYSYINHNEINEGQDGSSWTLTLAGPQLPENKIFLPPRVVFGGSSFSSSNLA